MPNPHVTPEFIRASLEGYFPGDLGIELTEITDERCVGRLAVAKRHTHPGQVVHGGVWTSLADTVAAWATMRALDPDTPFTTVEMKTNVFASAVVGDVLIAQAEQLHAGRRTQTWEVRVTKESRPERIAALFVCTQMVTA